MPPTGPDSLNDRAYADVEAYILQANGVATGTADLAAVRGQVDILAQSANHDAFYNGAIAARQKLLAALTPVTDAVLQKPADGDWLVWRRTWQNTSFSPLKQITKTNVKDLGTAWSIALPLSANEITLWCMTASCSSKAAPISRPSMPPMAIPYGLTPAACRTACTMAAKRG